MVWLHCDIDDQEKSLVSALWCSVCCKYEMKITGHKNISRAWIDGSRCTYTKIMLRVELLAVVLLLVIFCHCRWFCCQGANLTFPKKMYSY